jgi:hypothetical protein
MRIRKKIVRFFFKWLVHALLDDERLYVRFNDLRYLRNVGCCSGDVGRDERGGAHNDLETVLD